MAKVLLVDDEEAVRSYVRRALEMKGHEVTEAVDGGQALELLEQYAYDLLLTDIRMPVMDGIALSLKVASDQPGLPILLMTGYASEKQRAHNLDSLIKDVISKPFTLDQINGAVERAMS